MLTTILLLMSNMALVIWAQLTFPPPIIPTFPPQPTMNPVVNEAVAVLVGEPVIVPDNVRVTIDCSQLIDQAISSGVPNPTVTWHRDRLELSNGSALNVVISADRRLLIITDTLVKLLGTRTGGNYTCNVCRNFMSPNCSKTTPVAVCGEPNLLPPTSPPVVFPFFISITCGQDAVVPTLQGVSTLIIQCIRFNGSFPVFAVFKDGVLIRNSFPLTISSPSNDDFGTYTFSLSTEFCGTTTAVSRILRQVEEDCSVTNITGSLRHHQRKRRTKLQFSSGNPRATYRCKLDDEKFTNCTSPMIWRNLEKGRHTVDVRASCTDEKGRPSTVRRTFKVRVR